MKKYKPLWDNRVLPYSGFVVGVMGVMVPWELLEALEPNELEVLVSDELMVLVPDELLEVVRYK